ncbi:MAG: helix-turn-helix transcriptional regulator [Christensenellales bacterium]|jgi:AraC-like DNA-binding protein
MEWMPILSQAIHYMESHLTCAMGVEDVAEHVHASSANFQRVFNLVTGMTVGEYIRNRRLTLAGQDLLREKEKVIDVALRYQYDTPESFSKAFSRFHGVAPSSVLRRGANLKVFRPLTIQMTIQGGFDMARTLINHVPIHPMQYPHEGQNYVFNGCMKFLMECVGEPNPAYDYWFFSAVSGDSYVQVFNTNRDKWCTCLSQAKFDRELIGRVFDAIGYDFTYLAPERWRKDPQALRERIVAAIDRGLPVIGYGFDAHELNLPARSIRTVVGYENGGERFYRLTEEDTELVPFSLEDPQPYTFVFIEGKKQAPPVAQVYREALRRAPELMRTPPWDEHDAYFGNDAFEQWARMLEGDFYRMTREQFEAADEIAKWRYYCVYVCVVATNIYAKRHTTDRALALNPDLAPMAPLLERAYQDLDALEGELRDAGGDFNVTYELLQDPERSRRVAGILRKFPAVYDRICGIIQEGFASLS